MISRNKDVFLSLGSNIGNRFDNLSRAISRLDTHAHISIEAVSRFYETEPLYNKDQEDFLNCAVQVNTDLSPGDLLSACLAIEHEMGRRRTKEKNCPRIIDIDIVFFGHQIVRSDALHIPHNSYKERKFVLVPLCDIAPNFVCPDSHRSVRSMMERCQDRGRISCHDSAEMT